VRSSEKDLSVRLGIFVALIFLGTILSFETYQFFSKPEMCKAEIIQVNTTSYVYAGEFGSSRDNFIQAAHADFNFSCGNKGLVVEGVSCITLAGSSMQPTVYTGNTVITMPYELGQILSEGLLVSYDSPTGLRVHRITALYRDYLLVQGDNSVGNEAISYDNITRVVVGGLYT